MLSKKDKDWITKQIQKELKAALFREITVERNIPDKKGDVPGRIETSTANLLDMLVIDTPRLVQAIAGAEEASNQARNRSIAALKRIGDLEKAILAINKPIRIMARFAVALRESGLLDQLEKATLIEYIDESNPRQIQK